MFHFPPFASHSYVFTMGCHEINRGGFPHSEISGSKFVQQLPEAYRSLLRPSSPVCTKAFTVCS